ncbi:nucleotidyltransferase domain-containing protein [Pedobacter caeni]|uniref:nucleotidyltransferase domain-containing protein n=1 Tax=Pedobacter caeni TaxID=288992 RepID=UPI000933FF53|nr:nucleotidyltransferase domain-containing protein [Pedobacter caeni]
MKITLPDLPEAKINEINSIIEVIKEFVNPDKIILYGSYVKNAYVEDVYIKGGIKYYYISDYDLIIITNKTNVKEFELENELEKRLKVRPDINFFMYDIDHINQLLEKGDYFMVPVYNEGILLYDLGETTLREPKPISMAQMLQNSVEYYDYWLFNAEEHYASAQNSLQRNIERNTRQSLTAWNLFNTIESLYSTILLVYTGNKPKLHNLLKYRRSVKGYSEELDQIFPTKYRDSYERNLFDLLNRAYIGGKYKKEYEISLHDVQELNLRIGKMIEITKKMCLERIENYRSESTS